MSPLDYRRVDDDWMKMMELPPEKSTKWKSSCCWCCVGFTFTLGLTALFLWLSMIPSPPVIYLSYYGYIDTTGTGNTSVIYLELIPRNTNMVKKISYGSFNVNLSYRSYSANDIMPIGYNVSASGFHQGYPMKDRYGNFDLYSPNVTIFSGSGQLKHDMNRINATLTRFYVDVAVTWRIMNSKKGQNMVVGGSFYVDKSNYWYYSGILWISTSSRYWSDSAWGIQLKQKRQQH